jgi:hypothetical protein
VRIYEAHRTDHRCGRKQRGDRRPRNLQLDLPGIGDDFPLGLRMVEELLAARGIISA